MKKGILLFHALLFSITLALAQNPNVNFRFVKTNEAANTKTAVFTIVGVADAKQAGSLSQKIKALEGVQSFKIFYNRRCQLTLVNDDSYNADYIRSVLLSENTDFDIDYVTPLNKPTFVQLSEKKEAHPVLDYKANPITEVTFPSDFPKLIDTGNKEADTKQLAKAKQEWIENNPDKYREITGMEYLDYSNQINFIRK
jgi:hypothetical protein